jgi:hypothetical protein
MRSRTASTSIALATLALLAAADYPQPSPIGGVREPVKPEPRNTTRFTKAEKKRARKNLQRARLAQISGEKHG